MNVLLLFSMTGFFLWFCSAGIFNLFYPLTSYGSFLIALSVFTFLWSLTFCAEAWIGILILKLVRGGRSLIEGERSRLEGLVNDVQHEISLKTGFSPLSVEIFFEENPLPTIFTVGRQTLFLSRSLYEMSTDRELKGLIASELFFLHGGGAQRRFCSLILSLAPFSFAWILKESGKFLCDFSLSIAPKKKEALPFVAVQIIALFMGFLFIMGGCFAKGAMGILYIMGSISYQAQVFKSDLFAEKVGFGEGLLSFLYKIKNFDFEQSPRLLDLFYAPTPKIMLRIGRLEKALKTSSFSSFLL